MAPHKLLVDLIVSQIPTELQKDRQTKARFTGIQVIAMIKEREDHNRRRPHLPLENLSLMAFLRRNLTDKMATQGQKSNPKDSAQN
ncbi:MAG: hypothetical protein ACJA1E_001775 [Paracoccaceae bacterium]|jgi:hypothetical protein|tara:strand:+ start:72 stop:329 length:258 start_codon:yes stop_codon:yes gene_type:complete